MTAPTLTEFLLARIADDEGAAKVQRDGLESLSFGMGALSSWLVAVEANGIPTTSIDYTRVLAECEAKRRIVARHSLHPHYPVCEWCYVSEPEFQAAPYPCVELRDMASAYADHPDFDEAWRP